MKGWEKVALIAFAFHMITTGMPLFFLPKETFTGFLAPTLEGQYIIKNLALIAVAINIKNSKQDYH